MLTTDVDSYQRTREFTARLGGEEVRYVSKPGLPGWDQITSATKLLAEHAWREHGGKLLLLGCSHGALAAFLARKWRGSSLWMSDTNIIATRCAEQTLVLNGLTNAQVYTELSLLPEQAESFTAAAIEIPKGRKLSRRWLLEAFHLLQPGGELLLAGANQAGIQPLVKDAEDLFGPASTLGYRKGSRAVRMVKPETSFPPPGWSQAPGITPGTWHEFSIDLGWAAFSVRSLPGVFSYDRLDEGTALLLSHLLVAPGEHVLDAGCGYGIIGLAAAKKAQPGKGPTQVELVDANLLAVAAARETLTLNQARDTAVRASDLLEAIPEATYDLILSNPPFHTGQGVDYAVAQALISQSYQALRPGGRLVIVANRFIRYERIIQQSFRRVTVLAQTGKYHVLEGIKGTAVATLGKLEKTIG